MTDYLHIPFTTITGQSARLADYKGKIVLLVNVASECGFTPQYAGLEALYRNYIDKNFVVIGFPANNFGSQEPGTDEQILQFCKSTFDVTFPMMSKISVRGDDIHPLYRYLTTESPIPGEITWNFNKILLDKNGKVAARFDSKIKPEDKELTDRIRSLVN